MKYCGKLKNEIIDDLRCMEGDTFFNIYFNTKEVWYFNNQISTNKSVNEYSNMMTSIMREFFNVNEEKYLIVGSAKLGFSLSPSKKFRTFSSMDAEQQKQSDIDVAVVSSELFNELWSSLKLLKYRTHVNSYSRISSNIFRGFVNDKNIYDQISLKTNALDKIDQCTIALRDEFGVIEPINYRFYNSWKDLEMYTIDGIIKCKGEKNGI